MAVTKQSDINEIFKALGWQKENYDGDIGFVFGLEDRVLSVSPHFGKNKVGEKIVCARPWISTAEFNQAFAYIHDNRKILVKPLITDQCGFLSNGLNQKDVEALAPQFIECAKKVDIPGALANFRHEKFIDSAGNRPLFHLAALAVNGDHSTLEDYLTVYATQGSPFAVRYIDDDYLKRAIEIAEKVNREKA